MEIINLNKKIYPRQAVERAVADWHSLAEFSICAKPKYWQVEITQIDQQIKNKIKDEFANYVLGLLA